MLEDCADLPACEITLSERDIEILANFVRQKITPSISRGTAYLKTKTSTFFVCFLVGMGRFYDKQAGYWPIVEEKVGQIDLNWKVKWGKLFIQYLTPLQKRPDENHPNCTLLKRGIS